MKVRIYELSRQLLDGTISAEAAVRELPDTWTAVRTSNPENNPKHVVFEIRSGSEYGVLPVKFEADAPYIGCILSFGYPLPVTTCTPEDFTWYIAPDNFETRDFEALALGVMPFKQFHDVMAFTALREMSVLREKFPTSCLIMRAAGPKPLRRGLPQTPDHYFELWSQRGGQVTIHSLPATSSPFEAAECALELGEAPTIYRCLSGQMVPFKSTPGGVFL